MNQFKRWLSAGAVLFAAAAPLRAVGHPAFQDQMKRLAESKIPENLDLSRERSGASFVVRYAAEAPGGEVPVAELHAWTVAVETKDGRPVPAGGLELSADMPQHRHGLGSVPRVTPLGSGRFRIDGLNFPMPGWWQVKLTVGGETYNFDLVL